jgi:DNA invertase Pin-like site-specific DNA recombinase
MHKRAGIYVRVSTDKQTVENQLQELRQIAEGRGWEIVQEYQDAGISGARGRDERPGLDEMLKDAQRRRFDVVMAWAIDRLGRSLIDLLGTIQSLQACGVDLYFDQQSIDTTTPAGRLMFQITGAFAEFERSMIRQRVRAGLKRAKEAGKRLGRQDRSCAGKTNPEPFAGRQGHVGCCSGMRRWRRHGATGSAGNAGRSPFRKRKRSRMSTSKTSIHGL